MKRRRCVQIEVIGRSGNVVETWIPNDDETWPWIGSGGQLCAMDLDDMVRHLKGIWPVCRIRKVYEDAPPREEKP